MALMLEGKPDRAPLWELYVAPEVQSAFLGRPVRSAADEAEFWIRAGYDYVPVSCGLLQVAQVMANEGSRTASAHYSLYDDAETEITWAAEGEGAIASWDDFERFEWPDAESIDLTRVVQMRHALPPAMGLICVIGKIFTPAWMLMGFARFAEATIEQPDLVAAVMQRVGEIQFRVFQRCIDIEGVSGAWMSDDVAYTEGLLVRPQVLREHLWPWYRRMGEICRERGLVFCYHSDGDLREVLDDIIDCGFHGLHPIEPKAMDSRELKRTVGDRLCLLGNIELDRLARGTPGEVRELVRANLRDLGYNGGYGVGSSNSVTNYVPLANYHAMIDAAME
jgi:uroporphyrinogen decarboxylase